MNKTALTILSTLLLASVVLAGCGLAQEPQAPSQPIEAAPLATATEAPPPEPTTAPEPTATTAPAEATAAPTATSAPSEEPTAAVAPAAAIFEIIPAESEARFKIDETLQGAPKTVIGVTDQVAGQLEVDPANPAATRVGEIRVNARGLTTDNNFRNRAIKNWILKTDQFEFVTFTPAEITGMPESVQVGQPFSFQIKGDLTVTDVTLPVVFEVNVTPVSESRIEGLASTTILHKDFNLAIPDAPVVDEVKDEVILELDFVAQAQ